MTTDERAATRPGIRPPTPVLALARTRLPTNHGEFTAIAFVDETTGIEHVALTLGLPAGLDDLAISTIDLAASAMVGGEPATTAPVLVRVHSECLTGDVFGSQRCDCGAQLEEALARCAAAGQGVVVYLRGHEGRGIGLGHKLAAYALQDSGHDTVEANEALGFEADHRSYAVAAAILVQLGVERVRLLTNNPAKCAELEAHGVRVAERVPLVVGAHPENVRYLTTKRDKLGHLLDVTADE